MSKQAKQLGSWGLVVALAGYLLNIFIPFAWVIGLGGLIAAIVGYFKASDELGEPGIKANVIKAIVIGVIATVVLVVGGGAVLFGMVSQMMEGGGGMGVHLGGAGLLIMLLAWIGMLVATWFWYKANALLSERTNVNLFKTGGLLMFVGAILAVILIGGLISLVGEILLIVAWFSVPEGTGTA